jgi:hypothetical protein
MSHSFKKMTVAIFVLPIFSWFTSIDLSASVQPKKIAFRSLCGSGACLKLVKNPKSVTNELGNPIYSLELYRDGKLVDSFISVSGRAYTQNRNRNLRGSEAPLPDGIYSVSSHLTNGLLFEVGDKFLPIYPRFSTGRSGLGIHYDPSFNKNNGEDGTSGCIGLATKSDRDLVQNFVLKYQTKTLVVELQ